VGQPPLLIVVIIVMGVAGAGKTTVGRLLAAHLHCQFRDADEFHSAANIEKMRSGRKLDDRDRGPWLQAMADAIDAWLRDGSRVVLACSALKESYRSTLVRDAACVRVVYLKISREVAHARVSARTDHFMPTDLVDSQFEALEEPSTDEEVWVCDVADSVEHIVSELTARALHDRA